MFPTSSTSQGIYLIYTEVNITFPILQLECEKGRGREPEFVLELPQAPQGKVKRKQFILKFIIIVSFSLELQPKNFP